MERTAMCERELARVFVATETRPRRNVVVKMLPAFRFPIVRATFLICFAIRSRNPGPCCFWNSRANATKNGCRLADTVRRNARSFSRDYSSPSATDGVTRIARRAGK
jgi:hypothetical protein